MEYEKIRQLIDDMGESKLTAIDIDFPDGTKISMKKEIKYEVVNNNEILVKDYKECDEKTEVVTNRNTEIKGNTVKSPMVGTFYLKPSPTSVPYVEVGKQVKIGDTLCIIEAMKLMNEIESEFEGEIKEILVKDGEIVEYGTPLFVIQERQNIN